MRSHPRHQQLLADVRFLARLSASLRDDIFFAAALKLSFLPDAELHRSCGPRRARTSRMTGALVDLASRSRDGSWRSRKSHKTPQSTPLSGCNARGSSGTLPRTSLGLV